MECQTKPRQKIALVRCGSVSGGVLGSTERPVLIAIAPGALEPSDSLKCEKVWKRGQAQEKLATVGNVSIGILTLQMSARSSGLIVVSVSNSHDT
jgi:hypothetical protein